jgi:release factor glutamine methyltransferase
MPEIIGRLYERGKDRLRQAGIADAEISIRLILQNRLQKNPVGLQLSLNESIDESTVQQIEFDIERRAGNFPLQYIIGEVEFYNIKLKVDERALIPRPETEILVEQALTKAKWIEHPRILDIGVGSGNISIALAVNIPNAKIAAIDISDKAIELAKENAQLNRVESRIEFIEGDCLQSQFWKSVGKYDIVVSNPPYVDEVDFKSLQPEVRDYEPKIALVAEGEVLKYYRAICSGMARALNRGGFALFEVGYNQAESVEGILRDRFPEMKTEIVNDLNSIRRVVIGELTD